MLVVSSKKKQSEMDKIVQTGLAAKSGQPLNTGTGSIDKIVETGKQSCLLGWTRVKGSRLSSIRSLSSVRKLRVNS